MGSSWGMSVFLSSFKVKASSSNCNVKMAPGGVQVPTIKWCFIVTMFVVEKLEWNETG